MPDSQQIRSVTIIGVGLLGGSIALALKKAGFKGEITGCSRRSETLQTAISRGAIDKADADPVSASKGRSLVVLAAPVDKNIELLRLLAEKNDDLTVITDVGSTKQEITAEASRIFGPTVLRHFLPGHPMAGKEVAGIEHAEAELFNNTTWLFAPPGGRQALVAPEFSNGIHADFMKMVEKFGARLFVTDPESHDRVAAYTSHLVQIVSSALSATVMDAVGQEPARRALGGRAIRDMLRLAKSDTAMWSAISSSNRQNIATALRDMETELAKLREALGTEAFDTEFERARTFDPDKG